MDTFNLDLTRQLNPKFEIYEVVGVEDNYALLTGKMGDDDNPHYFVVNLRYGIVEAAAGVMVEANKLWEFCLDRPKVTGKSPVSKDHFN
jgi:hypothetical protein